MKLIGADNCACLFCGGREKVQTVARDDGAASISICAACREELTEAWASGTALAETQSAMQSYSEETKRVIAEAAVMTEEQFEEKYLSDEVDRVVFEYVRGYGQTDLLGSGMGLLSIMTEQKAEVVKTHIEGLAAAGLIYPVAGKTGWYGADYPFADD